MMQMGYYEFSITLPDESRQEDEVIETMEKQGLKFSEKYFDGLWVSVAMTR
jgi:hypothetical protein